MGGFRVRRGVPCLTGAPSAPVATRRRPEGRGRTQSAPESGGGFPGGVCPVGPSPKVPGRLAGGFVSGGARRWRQPSVGTISRPVGAPSAPHPTWTPPPIQCRRDRLQKGEGYIPLPHHVTPRPSQLKAAQSSKDYCGLTYVTTTRRCGSSPSEWVMTSSLSTRARCMILRS